MGRGNTAVSGPMEHKGRWSERRQWPVPCRGRCPSLPPCQTFGSANALGRPSLQTDPAPQHFLQSLVNTERRQIWPVSTSTDAKLGMQIGNSKKLSRRGTTQETGGIFIAPTQETGGISRRRRVESLAGDGWNISMYIYIYIYIYISP